MGRIKALQLLVILLLAIFLWQYVARIFFASGANPAGQPNFRNQARAARLFPFDYYLLAEAAQSVYDAGLARKDNAMIGESVLLLRRSLGMNPLYYPAHALLAKALIAKGYPLSRNFNEAIEHMKIAAKIRPGHFEIAIDTARLLFSLWPFIDDDEKHFCRELLFRNIKRIGWKDFAPLLELWWNHVRDIQLLVDLMKENPGLYYPVSQRLVDFRLPLPLRWEFLAAYERYLMEDIAGRYQNLTLQAKISEDEKRMLLSRVREIRGYGQLLTGEQQRLDWQAALEMKKKVLLALITVLTGRDAAQLGAGQRREIEELAIEYLSMATMADRLNDMREILSRAAFFRPDDLRSLLIRALIDFKSNAHWDVISQVDAFKRSLSFIKRESASDYIRLMLILTDAYIASRLLSQAGEVLRELRGLAPTDPEIYWRLLKVEAIFGPEEGENDEVRIGKEAVRQSRFLLLKGSELDRVVYIFDQPEVEITLDEALRRDLGRYRLFQVFLDGRIVFEAFADQIPEKVIIPPALLVSGQSYRIQARLLR